MRTPTTLRYEENGDIATVTLVRPKINMAMVRELTAVCDHLEDQSEASFVVFRGAEGIFSAGIDFSEFRHDQPMDIHGFNKWEKICVRIENLPKVTVAALEGAVVGGGVQLALVCDARIATSTTTLQLPEVKHGFLPGMATYRLAKYVGLGRAKQLIMQSKAVDAHRAEALGLIDEVVYDIDDGVHRTVEAFRPAFPITVQLARRLLNESYATSFEYAIGNFLAAQHRATSQSEFLQTVKKAQEASNKDD